MSAISPTSGPWQIKHDFDIEGSTTIIGNVDGEIIDGTTHATYDFVARTLDIDDDSQSHSIAVANARLIAAAPDLLEALLTIRHQWAGHAEECAFAQSYANKCDCDWPFIAAKCDAAIAKATDAA